MKTKIIKNIHNLSQWLGFRYRLKVLFYILLFIGAGYTLIFGNSVPVRAAYLPNEFVTVWKTDNPGVSASNQIRIPTFVGETYSYSVAWEEVGNPTNNGSDGVFTGDATITFPSAGNYEVRITGTFPRIQTQDLPETPSDRLKLLEVRQWGTNQWTSMNSAFRGAANLVITAIDTPDLSNVTDMSFMFSNATNFNSDISNWNVGNVTNIGGMFFGAPTFNQPLNNWDVSNVTSIAFMFTGATSFNQPLNNWDVSNVTSSGFMFAGATSFNQPLNNWDVSNFTELVYAFAGAASFNQPLNNWDVSNVTDMQLIFINAASFNQPLNNWDVSNVTNMGAVFHAAKAFNQSLDNWDVSNVTNLAHAFAGATSFNQPLNNWDVSNVTDMTRMFQGATVFNQPLSSWDVTSVSSMFAMFYYATSFNQPLGTWNVVNLTDAAFMLMHTSLSPANYDNLLEGWSNRSLKNNVQLWVGTGYCSSGAARSKIATTFRWNIVDSGNFCPPNVVITTTKLSSAAFVQGIPLSVEIQTADAFNSNTIFTVISGTLPPGLQLLSIGGGKGQITGTPTTPGRYVFVVQVYDGNSYSTQEYTITIFARSTGIVETTTADPEIKSEEPRRQENNNRNEDSSESANAVETGIINLAKRLGVAPETIINTAPWAIIALLLVFTIITGVRIIQQTHISINTKRLASRQELLNHEKRSLLTLATHYLRTPMTIIAADVDKLDATYDTLISATASLKITIEQIVQGIEADQSKNDVKIPDQLQSFKRSILHPSIIIPVVATSTTVIIINVLLFTTTNFSPALMNIGAQMIAFMIISGILYISYSQYRQQKLLKNYQLKIVKHQEGIDSARNEVIGDVVDKLIPAVDLVESSIPRELDSKHAKYLHEGLSQLNKVTDNFDLIRKLDTDVLRQQSSKVSLTKILKTVRAGQGEHNAFSINVKPGLRLKQPEYLLQKVLSTVAENAIAHNKPDKKAVITARRAGNKIKIDVKDFGEGIPKDKLDLLFKPLSRVESAEDFTHQGMGLSLYINSLIMHYLGGDITVSSKVGDGTTVHLELPSLKQSHF